MEGNPRGFPWDVAGTFEGSLEMLLRAYGGSFEGILVRMKNYLWNNPHGFSFLSDEYVHYLTAK